MNTTIFFSLEMLKYLFYRLLPYMDTHTTYTYIGLCRQDFIPVYMYTDRLIYQNFSDFYYKNYRIFVLLCIILHHTLYSISQDERRAYIWTHFTWLFHLYFPIFSTISALIVLLCIILHNTLYSISQDEHGESISIYWNMNPLYPTVLSLRSYFEHYQCFDCFLHKFVVQHNGSLYWYLLGSRVVASRILSNFRICCSHSYNNS